MLTGFGIQAQHTNVPLNREVLLKLESHINASDSNYHTGAKPYLYSRVVKPEFEHLNMARRKYFYLASDLIWRRHLLEVKKPDFYFSIDPLFNFEFGSELEGTYDRPRWKNTRGLVAEGTLGKNLSFHTRLYENQATLPDYLNTYVAQMQVMPGQGRTKPFKDTIGFDYSATYGYISWNINRKWNVQFGQDKLFIGDGYRSMLLSDNAFNFPGIRASGLLGDSGKWQYTTSINVLQTLERMPESTTPEALFVKKGGHFHYLSYNASPQLQLGLFEGTIFERVGTGDSTKAYHFGYYLPLLGLNTLLQGFSGTNNVVLGLNLKYRFHKRAYCYGQLAVDDPKERRMGWQAGVKVFEPFGKKGLYYQMEYNGASPYVYSHERPRQNYAHMNQPLAHPLGGSFNEILGIINLDAHYWYAQAKIHGAVYTEDFGIFNYGSNIFNSNLEANEPGATPTHLMIGDVQMGYKLNRHTKARLFFGIFIRQTRNVAEDHKTMFLYFGLRTNLNNYYFDF